MKKTTLVALAFAAGMYAVVLITFLQKSDGWDPIPRSVSGGSLLLAGVAIFLAFRRTLEERGPQRLCGRRSSD